jgi:hypothetical protein
VAASSVPGGMIRCSISSIAMPLVSGIRRQTKKNGIIVNTKKLKFGPIAKAERATVKTRQVARGYGQASGSDTLGTTKVGLCAAVSAFSVPLCAVCPTLVTASAVVVPEVSSNFQ